jgi:AcrR family transcriptional regulator
MAEQLRRDAADNRRRLLAAAREVFAEHGLDATLHDVAKRAGVGVGTAYRRFANKEQLIDAVLADQVNELETVLRESLAETDAWAGIVHYLERSVAIQAADRGMAQIMSGRRVAREQYDWERDRLAHLVEELTERAVREGAVRDDLKPTDLIFLQLGLVAIAHTLRQNSAAVQREDVASVYRRYLAITLDGVRPRAPRTELLVDALTTEETHQILWKA